MSAGAGSHRGSIRARIWAGLAALCVIFAAGPLYVWYHGDAVLSPNPLDRKVTIRFRSDASGMGWQFHPQQERMQLALGETGLAFFDVENPGKRPMAGRSTYAVAPPGADRYLIRVACFCTETQVLAPGERAEVPMGFLIDPAILYDRAADGLHEITLTYSFHETDLPAAPATAPGGDGAAVPARAVY
ncbi:cytochrome c oxidase assembly protein [Acidimangrovimonas sediminis]|uniref:cytochrome c oxidase assembly protein n=1 Tax=Acidimangrovimonas sediminis TaxID=2056283 RepID=UPI000C8037BE|nr:cytochrome c oxidase assembly protein [Acidimangrovimonas sediminis]